jgi:ubiquinone biosynthesis monooxygenase Coq7
MIAGLPVGRKSPNTGRPRPGGINVRHPITLSQGMIPVSKASNHPMTRRHFNPIDRFLIDAQNALGTVFGSARARRPNPGEGEPEIMLDDIDRRHAAGLMRVNHVGEVCAQALYVGQAAVARDERTRTQLLAAAQEETDHLAWCAQRLRELDSRPSLLNPLWYASSYAIGALAGLRGDGWNLGFVVETERQVEAHLDAHLQTLPAADARSRAILTMMKADEARHAEQAEAQGARALPQPVPMLMAAASKLMKTIAYRV